MLVADRMEQPVETVRLEMPIHEAFGITKQDKSVCRKSGC